MFLRTDPCQKHWTQSYRQIVRHNSDTRRHSHADHTTATRSRSGSLTSYSPPSLASLYLSLSPCGTWKESSNSTHSEVRQNRLSIMMDQAGEHMGCVHERTRTRPTDDATRVALVRCTTHTSYGWAPHVALGHFCAQRKAPCVGDGESSQTGEPL